MHAFWTSSLQLAIFVRRSQGGGGYSPGVVFKSWSPPTLMQPTDTDTTPRIDFSRRLLVCLSAGQQLAVLQMQSQGRDAPRRHPTPGGSIRIA